MQSLIKNVPSVEVHVKAYAQNIKTGNILGLQTRVIINNPIGNSEVKNFEYQLQALKYIKERFGEFRDGNFQYVNLAIKYGKRGYKW
jgi:hypothetical protein